MYKNFEFSDIGSKSVQEDNKLIFKLNNIDFYFIFDGHGYKKKEVSLVHFLLKNNFLKNKLILYFQNNDINSDNIKTFFVNLDKELLEKNINSCVCVAGIIYYVDKIYIFNIGDTLVYVFNKQKQNIFQNHLHNLYNNGELNRIQRYNKMHHVKNNRYKKLSITRTLGDKDCKDETNEPLIACPDVYVLKNDALYYFLIATDGINIGYNIEKIIKMYNLYNNKQLYDYCKTIAKNNLKQYKDVDNVLFYILSNKKKNILYKIMYNSIRFNI